MTFKEQLIAKVEQCNIKKDVEYIKNKMETFYFKREFTISLIKAHDLYDRLAISNANSNRTSLFVPSGISPEEYLKLFVEAFKNLGFTSDDIITTYADNEYFESYDIILKW